MRPIEIVIPFLLAIYIIWPNPRPFMIGLAPAFALLLTLIHFYIEGYRWQMIPLYALTLILSALTLFARDLRPVASALILILLAVSTGLPMLLPVPKVAQPGGPHEVGTTIYEFIDTSRKELYSGKDEPRRLMVQVWYPAQLTSTAKHAPWMADAKIYAPAISSGLLELPPFFLDHLELSVSPAYLDLPLAETSKPYPLILFSHGWLGFNTQNTGQAVELASHGFVVIATQHTYGAIITVFRDGSIAKNNPKALPENADDPNYEGVARVLVNQWAEDISFVLDQFQGFNEAGDNPFFQKLDLERVGVYGHSTGGGAAIQFCGVDDRCKAVLGMDPFMRPVSAEVIENGISQPSFFMFSQSWTDLVDSRNNKLFNQFYPNTENNAGVISIMGTKHFDFSDLPLLSPITPQLGLKGPLNGRRVTEIVNTYLLDFFEMTLKNKSSSLFSGLFNDFNEVKAR